MPQRSQPFKSNSIYHIYNRGVEKRPIFNDQQDYLNFLDIITYYLTFVKKSFLNAFAHQPHHALNRTQLKTTGIFQTQIQLLCFCLLPNHFHFLLHQHQKESISHFIRRLSTTYALYFNRRYHRVGPLFQGRFKAKHIDSDAYLLQASKYIHLNLPTRPGVVTANYNSYLTYIGRPPPHQINNIINTQPVLSYFHHHYPHQDYSHFVHDSPLDPHYQNRLTHF